MSGPQGQGVQFSKGDGLAGRPQAHTGKGSNNSKTDPTAKQGKTPRESKEVQSLNTGCGTGPCGACDKCAVSAKQAVQSARQEGSPKSLIADALNAAAMLSSTTSTGGPSLVVIKNATGNVVGEAMVTRPPAAAATQTADVYHAVQASVANALRGDQTVAATVSASAVQSVFTGTSDRSSSVNSSGLFNASTAAVATSQASATPHVTSIDRITSGFGNSTSDSSAQQSTKAAVKPSEQPSAQAQASARESVQTKQREAPKDSAAKQQGTPTSREANSTNARESSAAKSETATRSNTSSASVTNQSSTATNATTANVTATNATASVRADVQRAVQSLLKAEQSVKMGVPATQVAQALQQLSSTMAKASSSSPALEASAKQAGLLAKVATNSTGSSAVSVKVVQAQLSSIREAVTKTVVSLNATSATRVSPREGAASTTITASVKRSGDQVHAMRKSSSSNPIASRTAERPIRRDSPIAPERQRASRETLEGRSNRGQQIRTARNVSAVGTRAKDYPTTQARATTPTAFRSERVQSMRSQPGQGLRERIQALRERLRTRGESPLSLDRQRNAKSHQATRSYREQRRNTRENRVAEGRTKDGAPASRSVRRNVRDGASLKPKDARLRTTKERTNANNQRQTRGERNTLRSSRAREGMTRKNGTLENRRTTALTGRREANRATSALRDAIQKLRSTRRAAKNTDGKIKPVNAGTKASRDRKIVAKTREGRGERNVGDSRSERLSKGKIAIKGQAPRKNLEKRAARQTAIQRAVERQRASQRRREPSTRSMEAALQNEIAKVIRRTVKKLLRNEEEELLRLLSPMEQRLIDEISRQIDPATTIADLQKNLKKARSKSGSGSSATAETSTQETQGAGQSQSGTAANSQGTKNTAEQQPSKSLDLVTSRVDDGNNKNSYEAMLRG